MEDNEWAGPVSSLPSLHGLSLLCKDLTFSMDRGCPFWLPKHLCFYHPTSEEKNLTAEHRRGTGERASASLPGAMGSHAERLA